MQGKNIFDYVLSKDSVVFSREREKKTLYGGKKNKKMRKSTLFDKLSLSQTDGHYYALPLSNEDFYIGFVWPFVYVTPLNIYVSHEFVFSSLSEAKPKGEEGNSLSERKSLICGNIPYGFFIRISKIKYFVFIRSIYTYIYAGVPRGKVFKYVGLIKLCV